MKIYSISVLKNEEDVIEQNLLAALKWSDKIFVLDNGSTDNSWEIVKKLSLTNKNIIAWKQLSIPFFEGIRALVYNEFKNISEEGDWWCFRLDADEFYIDDPITFLKNIPTTKHVVCKESIEYFLTHEDIEEYTYSNFKEDINKIKYYHKKSYVEPRFFRYRERLTWNPNDPSPKHMGIIENKLIKAKHFQYRSPKQIQNRLNTRKEAIKSGFKGWDHANQNHYKEKLMHRSELNFDLNNNSYQTEIKNSYKHTPLKLIVRKILHGLKILP